MNKRLWRISGKGGTVMQLRANSLQEAEARAITFGMKDIWAVVLISD